MNGIKLPPITLFALGMMVLVCLGCSYYQSRYFELYAAEEARIAQFNLAPRIFACQDEKILLGDTACDNYSVSIRVREGTGETDAESWQQDMATVDSLSDAFFNKVAEVFRADSLLLEASKGSEAILLHAETDRYLPRRHNYFTLRFGSIDIPSGTGQLRMVLHVSRRGESGRYAPDSVIWHMAPIDTTEYGLYMFRANVRGYE